MKGMKQTKLPAFLNLKSEIVNISKGNNGMIENFTGNPDMLAKTAIYLTKKSEIRNNVKQRPEL